jgi:hypothetical protein
LESIQLLEENGGSSLASPLADGYARLRLISAKTLLEAESDAAFAIAEAFPRKLTIKSSQLKRSTKRQK